MISGRVVKLQRDIQTYLFGEWYKVSIVTEREHTTLVRGYRWWKAKICPLFISFSLIKRVLQNTHITHSDDDI